jgi:anti-sigma-K factor RskA
VSEHNVLDAVPLYAIDALDPDEAAAVEAHTDTCGECRDTLAAEQELAAELALIADPLIPDPALRQRILAAAAAIPQAVPLAAHARRRRPLRRRRRLELNRVIANEQRFLDGFAGPVGSFVPLVAAKRSVKGSAQVYVSADGGTVGLVAAGLADPGSNVYQLWLLAGGQPVPVEAFRPDAHGQALVTVRRRLRSADAFAISLERTPNPPSPLGPILLRSA